MLHCLSELSWDATSLNSKAAHDAWLGLGVLLYILDVVVIAALVVLLDRRELHL